MPAIASPVLPLARLLTFLCFLATLLLAGWSAPVRAAEYSVGKPAAWVLPLQAATAARAPDRAAGGIEYLLSDVQRRVEHNRVVSYVHMAARAVESAGVDENARFSVSFDPLYQSVTLHSIDLQRGGRRVSKMGSATIRVMQRETELEARIFDGRKTINVEIDDVRVGDVVEFAYTVSGANPVFANIYAGSDYLQWSVPMERAFVRLLVPQDRIPRIDNSKAGGAPVVHDSGGYRDYRWDRTGVPALRLEKDAPSTYDPYAQVQWSEFADWGAVARWALPLYKLSAPSPELAREIARIAAASRTPEQRLAAALRLAQREIRYLGVETGASSHAPSPASLVYQRRFGDCKDKTVLLLTMLAALGIEAEPALVHSSKLRAENAALASPHVFNHVIVRAKAGGIYYWIDPTRAEQHGDLAHLFEPDYGLALVLAPGTTALTQMPASRFPRRHIESTFDLRAGLDKPAGYVVTTTLQGDAADQMRANIVRKGVANMQADYLNYYARKYPSVALAAPMQVKDDKTNNKIVTTESYTISKLWSEPNDNGRQQAVFDSHEITALLTSPEALNRVAPLPLKFPEEVHEVTVVKLFTEWNATPVNNVVKDAAFDLTNRVALSDDLKTLTITDSYRTLADRVAPERMREYAANLGKAGDTTGHALFWNASLATAPTPFLTAKDALMIVLLLSVVALLFSSKAVLPADRDFHRTLVSSASWVLVAVVLVWWGVDTPQGVITLFCTALAVLAILAVARSRHAPDTYWLHPTRTGRHGRTVRDLLIGSSVTMLAFRIAM